MSESQAFLNIENVLISITNLYKTDRVWKGFICSSHDMLKMVSRFADWIDFGYT